MQITESEYYNTIFWRQHSRDEIYETLRLDQPQGQVVDSERPEPESTSPCGIINIDKII